MKSLTIIALLLLSSIGQVRTSPAALGCEADVRIAVIPNYPMLPSGGREEGVVKVSGSVGTDGKLAHPQMLGGSDRLRDAVGEALSQWQFKPNKNDLHIQFSFALMGSSQEICRASIKFGEIIQVSVCEIRKKVVFIADPPVVEKP